MLNITQPFPFFSLYFPCILFESSKINSHAVAAVCGESVCMSAWNNSCAWPLTGGLRSSLSSDGGNVQNEAGMAGKASMPLSSGILMSREIKERCFAQARFVRILFHSQTSKDGDTMQGYLSQLQLSMDATSTLSSAGPESSAMHTCQHVCWQTCDLNGFHLFRHSNREQICLFFSLIKKPRSDT